MCRVGSGKSRRWLILANIVPNGQPPVLQLTVASVFTTAVADNPTLTIAALALKTAGHIDRPL